MAYIETLSEDEIQSLLSATSSGASAFTTWSKSLRTRLMILLMSDAGLRIGELVKLKWVDIFAHISPVQTLLLGAHLTKTKVPRSIPTTPRLRDAILNFQKNQNIKPDFNMDFYVFFSKDNTHAISTRQVRRIIGNLSQSYIGRRISPHTLRHTFATRLLRYTSTRVVQELLGHKSLSSTQVYTHPNSIDLGKAIGQMAEGSI